MKHFFAAFINALSFLPVAFAALYILELAGANFSAAFAGIFLCAALGTALWGKFIGSPVVVFPNYAITASFLYIEVICRGETLDALFNASFFAAIFGICIIFLSRYCKIIGDKIDYVFKNIFSSKTLTSAFLFGTALFLILEGLNLSGLILSSPFYFAMTGDIYNPVAKFSLIGIAILLLLYAKNKKFAIITPTVLIIALSYIEGYVAVDEIFAFPAVSPQGFEIAMDFTVFRLTVEIFLLMYIIGNFWKYLFNNMFKIKGEKNIFPIYITNAISAFFGLFMLLPSPISLVGCSVGGDKKISYFTALFFVIFIFLEPLAKSLMSFTAVYAPALVGAGIFTLLQIKPDTNSSLAEKLAGCAFIAIFPLTRDIVTALLSSAAVYFIIKSTNKNS